jgi:uncharacterized delta-60 repeat protein
MPVGCDGSDDSDVIIGESTVTIDQDLTWYTDRDVFEWNTMATVARVEVKVRGYNHGSFRIRILDAAGAEVFDKIYYSPDWWWYVDSEFYDVAFTTTAVPGLWTIINDFDEFTGHLYLTLTDTMEEPDDTVPPPTEDSSLLDLTFGTNGRATYTEDQAFGSDVVVDPLGRIVITGTVVDFDGNRALAVWRLRPDGAPDLTFGAGGAFLYNEGVPTRGTRAAIDGSGRILVTGLVPDLVGKTDLVLLRLTPAGALDPSFGARGRRTINYCDYE